MAADVAHANPVPATTDQNPNVAIEHNSGTGPIETRKLTLQDFRLVRTLGTGRYYPSLVEEL
jgi:hypothetical protein